jgi:hypothetical protein
MGPAGLAKTVMTTPWPPGIDGAGVNVPAIRSDGKRIWVFKRRLLARVYEASNATGTRTAEHANGKPAGTCRPGLSSIPVKAALLSQYITAWLKEQVRLSVTQACD